MIIQDVSLGGKYRKVTVRLILSQDCFPVVPGVCAQIDGNYYAIADSPAAGELTFVVKEGSRIMQMSPRSKVEVPVGRGFDAPETPDGLVVVGGTGLAAAVSLVTHRRRLDLSTTVVSYGRGMDPDAVLSEFPVLREDKVKFVSWDTERWGRPPSPMEPVFDVGGRGHHVFFAGPREMLETLRSDPSGPTLHLNF